MKIMPDHGLLLAAERIIDGANSHAIRQELNAYQLCIRALNESLPDSDRAEIEAMRYRTETKLRALVAKHRLAGYLKNPL